MRRKRKRLPRPPPIRRRTTTRLGAAIVGAVAIVSPLFLPSSSLFSAASEASRIRGQTVPQIDSTRHVCRISARQTQQHRQKKSTRHKIKDEPLSPYLPAASPSLSMATSAMDPDRFVAAPHEPDGGARRPCLRALRLVLLFGAP